MKKQAVIATIAVVLVSLAATSCAIDRCGPNYPSGPCEIECKPKNCTVGTYCCADQIGGCCDEGWSCIDDGTPEGHCDPPWVEGAALTRKARYR